MQRITTDRHFIGMADKFENALYNHARGRLRLAMLTHAIESSIPLHNQPLVDVGAGLGQMAHWAAERGHPVTLLEPAEDMLARARQRLAGYDARFHQSDLQALAERAPGPWPLIFCHAVLEWLIEPRAAIETLAQQLAPGGWLSLMVFNEAGLVMSNVVKGNLERVLDGNLAGYGRRKRLTPIAPLRHEQVVEWLHAVGLEVRDVTGIRVFHDYLREREPDSATLERLFELERRYCRIEPYWRLGRYLHYSVRRPA
ncbi:methyltransferase [Kushneria aurantia]|uniref:tRNA 5-carboxymethoxyuridine methyltransferase n=1 Tax=Kushneria aurantia TaxID=504092 RepID=A0ABV6G6L1_9GAMM|nr:methyltransferase [Kushneria aurantia]